MEPKEKYIAFCKSEPYLPIFFQPWYLDGVCPNKSWDAVVSERADKVVGIFPFHKKFKKPYNYISMPPNSRMMGPYVVGEFREEEIYRKLVKEMSKALPKVEFFYQCFHYAVSDWLIFYSQKYNGKKLYSFILNDFSDLKKTYSLFSRDVRDKFIPKAKKLVSIKKGLDPKVFFSMLKDHTTAINKKLDFEEKAFLPYHKALVKNKAGDIYYAEDEEGNIHAAGLLMWDKLSSYFYLKAESPEFRYSKALSYLTWHCIELTKDELNLDFFDFGGNLADAPDNATHPFGAKLIPFLNISRYDSQKFAPFKSMKKRAKRRRV